MKELRTLLFQKALYDYHAVIYFKKEIIISFFIITISVSDLYMPMIWLYLFLLDFLIPFLCGPDLQCSVQMETYRILDSSYQALVKISAYGRLKFTLNPCPRHIKYSEDPIPNFQFNIAAETTQCHRLYIIQTKAAVPDHTK